MSPASLESLTNELFELIVQYIDLQDIKNLRLVSRLVRFKATQDTFQQCFTAKKIELTRPSLESFVQFTSQGQGLGCLVKDLTLVGAVYNGMFLRSILNTKAMMVPMQDSRSRTRMVVKACDETELVKAQDHLDEMKRRQRDLDELRDKGVDEALLKSAFLNLAAHSPNNALKSLSLQIIIYREDNDIGIAPREGKSRRLVFQAAASAFTLVTSCLRESRLPVQSLDIFAKKPQSLRCSLPCDVLTRFDWQTGSTRFLSTLKSLSISLSDIIVVDDGFDRPDVGDTRPKMLFDRMAQNQDRQPLRDQISDDRNLCSLSRMLHLCDNLEELEISAYSLRRASDLEELQKTMRCRYMYHLARQKPLVHLRKLRLGGLHVRGEDLLRFLENHATSLRELEVCFISLKRGSFQPFLLYLKDMNLERIQLEDLWQGGELMLFDGNVMSDSQGTEVTGVHLGRDVLKLWGSDTKRQIVYGTNRKPNARSAEISEWMERMSMEFGRYRPELTI